MTSDTMPDYSQEEMSKANEKEKREQIKQGIQCCRFCKGENFTISKTIYAMTGAGVQYDVTCPKCMYTMLRVEVHTIGTDVYE